MYATHAPVNRACSHADNALCIGLQNTINVRVLSGLLCLYSIDIFVETIPAHLPITTIITTCTLTLRTPAHQPNPYTRFRASANTSTTGGGGGGDDKPFKMPIWGFGTPPR